MSTGLFDERCINTIRFLAVDAVEAANSGHPGMPMGAAAMAHALWSRCLKHSPRNPRWFNRDRFILSAGHGSALLYALLHLTGYDLALDELKRFRQWGSKTPGHPEFGHTPGVEVTTGPLGQGFATGVGLAIAERHLAARFNRPGFPVVDHYTYAIVGDGDLMEGLSAEAASLAGHLGLGKLIYLYDDNHISIEGNTEITFTEDVAARFAAHGWQVIRVADGNDVTAVTVALEEARGDLQRPSLILARTHIGFGSPNKQDKSSAHGEPLGKEEARRAKERLGWPAEAAFHVPDDVLEQTRQALVQGAAQEDTWYAMLARYSREYPEVAAEFARLIAGDLPADWESAIPVFEPGDGLATRAASGQVLNALASRIGELVGGSADLGPSNATTLKGVPAFQKATPEGRNFHFGVREHAMGSALNGMALHGLRPYGGTFLVFSDYMRPAIRLSALMNQPVVYVLTHDSIGLGEDGPTHQPIEHLASLRAMPNLLVLRPADANETAEAWRVAMQRKDGPTALILSRQKLPTLDRTVYAPASGLQKGAYVLQEAPGGKPALILMASGSELTLALQAAAELTAGGVPVRVVSFPSWELFAAQPQSYRDQVLPPSVTARVAVEAGSTFGWDRWVGSQGTIIGLDHFGASAPADELFTRFGLTVPAVVVKARELL